MSGPGRRVALPPDGHRRPPDVDSTGLVVKAVGESGEDLGTWDFTDYPGPEDFRRELVEAFARHGRANWNSELTYLKSSRTMLRFLRDATEADPQITAIEQIDVFWWKKWAGDDDGRRTFSRVLRAGPALPAVTRAFMETPRRRSEEERRPALKQSLTRTELKAVRDAAAATVRSSRMRIAGNTALMERWRKGELAPHSDDWQRGQLLDHLSRTADLPRCGGRHRVLTRGARRTLAGERFPAAVTWIFPSFAEAGAAAVLLIVHEGWNLSVLQKMKIPDFWPNADGDQESPVVQRVATDKPRRGRQRRHATNNLVDAGEASSGWAMSQVLDLTHQARWTLDRLGRPSQMLLLARRGAGGADDLRDFTANEVLARAIEAWADLQEENGVVLPAHVTGRLLRHSAQVQHGRPRNNTKATNERDYLLKDEAVREDSRGAVEAGLAKAVEQARARVEMRLVAQATGDTEHDADQVAKAAGVDRETALKIVAGQLKTPVASCTDFTNSDFTPAGLPCGVSFLLCFACRNAVATTVDLPRIVYLYKALEGLRSTLTAAAWATDWEAHHHRIGDFLTSHTDEGTWPELIAVLEEKDRQLIDRMLERRLDP